MAQYGNYYDPVGSQANQQTTYSYQTPTSNTNYHNAPASSNYGSTNCNSYANNSYGSQQYGTSVQQQTSSSANHAAAALSSLSSQNYSTTATTNAANSNSRYDNSNWNQSTTTNTYGTNPLAAQNRAQSNTLPLYSNNQSSSTFGNLSRSDQAQNTSNTYGSPQATYSNAPNSASLRNSSYYNQPQSQPPRYNSPLHAVQAQHHGHRQQVSQGSNSLQSPQMGNAPLSNQNTRQPSASVEPAPVTVDPSQVYDNRAELQRRAQQDAEKRRKYEAEQAAKKAEEERIAEEQRKQEESKKAEEAKKEAERKKKAREEKKQSKNAATALQRMSSDNAGDSGKKTEEQMEAEMRGMFQKMREFNAKNPEMLAKLWDEERKSHEAGKSATPVATATLAPKPAATYTPADEVRPFAKPPVPAKSAQPAKGSAPNSAAKRAPQTPAAQPAKPSPAPANSQLWPQHKKGALAEVTAKWLMSLQANAGKTVLPSKILSILDSNPAYVQLCESLETLGLSFDRSMLARELLKGVPDGHKAPQPAKATPPRPPSGTPQSNGATAGSPVSANKAGKQKSTGTPATSGPATTHYEAPMSLSDVAREVNHMGRQGSVSSYVASPVVEQSRYFASNGIFTNGSRAASQSQPPETKPEVKPEEPRRPPADKEEAARKRTFNDLVDLTQQDSDEDEPPPKKIMLPPSVQANGTSSQNQHLSKPTSFNQFMHQGTQQRPPSGFYVPGQRPQPRPSLSQPLQNQGPAVPAQSAPPSRPKGPAPEQLQLARMKGKMLVEPIMRDRVARKSTYDSRTIARDVLLATGRHPDMRGLNAHLAPMQKLLGQHGGFGQDAGYSSDLATIRWDVIDPEQKPSEDRRDVADKEKRDEQKDVEETASPKPSADKTSVPKKRGPGRPRKESPAAGSPVNGTVRGANLNTSRPATPSSQPRALPSKMAPANPTGYNQFQQFNADGTRKKGRPFGWKKSIHSREAQGLLPASKPAKKTPAAPPAAKKELVEPQYQVYKCGWEGCKSELHNLNTLKKHVVKVHGRDNGDGVYECRWEGCAKKVGGRMEEWVGHVDGVHLAKIRWELGDGPGDGDISAFFRKSDHVPPYLKDETGRRVTPLIQPEGEVSETEVPARQPTATDHEKDEDGSAASSRPNSSHNNLDQDKAMSPPESAPPAAPPQLGRKQDRSADTTVLNKELKGLADHQRIVGWTMGKQGAVLASEERRATFLDGEDFEGVVEVSDEEMG